MLKRSALKPKKNYTLKKSVLKPGKNYHGLNKGTCKLHSTSDLKFQNDILYLYSLKKSTSEICKQLNCAHGTVLKTLKKHNIIIKTKCQKPLILNKVYGNFKVLAFDHSDPKRGNFYLVECIHCHKQFIRQATYIRRNTIMCCTKDRGYSKTRLFSIWMGMRQRCNDKNCIAYVDYGERGIKVCEEWNSSFKVFEEWALLNGYNEQLSIERIDVNGNYCPENCKWITMKSQATNKRNNIRFFNENIAEHLQKNNWKKVRQYGLILFSKLVKASAGFKCELCGKNGIDAHHWYFTKAHNAITDIMQLNGICLCRQCHIAAHNNPKLYKEKISDLQKFKSGPKILNKVIKQPLTMEHAREIILRGRKKLREIYKKYNYNKDYIVEELLKYNSLDKEDTESED